MHMVIESKSTLLKEYVRTESTQTDTWQSIIAYE